MTDYEKKFFDQTVAAAQASAKATGVPASVTLAQCAIESGWLRDMPEGSNNPFGIKAVHLDDPSTYVDSRTPEYKNGLKEYIIQPFQKYATLADAFTAHANLIAKAPRYAPAMAVKGNLSEFLHQIMMCGYSTNRPPLASKPPYYADELAKLIRQFNLTQHDV
jgi:flagellum-specific peptidoglycan hydrolase FlgJ